MPQRRPEAIAGDAVELGRRMKMLRGRTGLRKLEKEQESKGPSALVISRAQLSRYERGEVLAPLTYAEHLDHLYDAQGWIDMSLKALWRPRWDPWADEWPDSLHTGSWPANYHNQVWVKITPVEANVGAEHRITMEWGPWGREISVILLAKGVVLTTGKARDADGISRGFNLAASRPVYTLFGAGEGLSGEHVIDIRRGWALRNEAASAQERLTGPA